MGHQTRTYHHDRQPWQLVVTDNAPAVSTKNGATSEASGEQTQKRERIYGSHREGGAGEHSDYWVFLKVKPLAHCQKMVCRSEMQVCSLETIFTRTKSMIGIASVRIIDIVRSTSIKPKSNFNSATKCSINLRSKRKFSKHSKSKKKTAPKWRRRRHTTWFVFDCEEPRVDLKYFLENKRRRNRR